MKTEKVTPHPANAITATDKEWTFITDENRPALVRLKQERLILYIGDKDKKSIYDGTFIESWSCKMDEKTVWEVIEKRLRSLTIKIVD